MKGGWSAADAGEVAREAEREVLREDEGARERDLEVEPRGAETVDISVWNSIVGMWMAGLSRNGDECELDGLASRGAHSHVLYEHSLPAQGSFPCREKDV
jgi:hypothetical protein